MDFSWVLKANPYRDSEGRFTDKEGSTGPLTLHRGTGAESSTSGVLTWSSPDKALAQGYADKRTDGRVETTIENFTQVFDAGRDAQEMNPSKFAVTAMMQAKQRGQVSDKDALAARAEFLKGQTSDSRKITDYWAEEEGKEKVSTLLQALGFDAVHILEGDAPTYGKLGKVKKSNPYRDENGRFTDKTKKSAFTYR